MSNPTPTKPKNYFKENMITILVYHGLFLIALLPFYELGFAKLFSISFILAFFASILNRFLVEYFEWKTKWLKQEENSNR
jgi:hypothetical protein